MIDVNDFIFNSDFNYMLVQDSGSTPVTGAFGSLLALKTGVTGTPPVSLAGQYGGHISTGAAGIFASGVSAVLRGGTLYARYATVGGFDTVEWRIYDA